SLCGNRHHQRIARLLIGAVSIIATVDLADDGRMSRIEERKMRKPVSLVEDDTFAGLKFPSRRPIGHHRVVKIDNWHASLLRRPPVKLKASNAHEDVIARRASAATSGNKPRPHPITSLQAQSRAQGDLP